MCGKCCYIFSKNFNKEMVGMNYINFISNSIIPIVITIIVIFGLKEKIKVFDTFLEGAKEGTGIVIALFPTLIGLFVAIGALRSSGIIDFLINLISPIIKILNIPKEIMPLAFLRPISRQCIYCNRNRYYETIWGR